MLILKSYAKLNLSLLITKKRSDGFHELKTIFERIDLYDTLKFSLRQDSEIHISSDCPHLPLDEKNLVYQAAMILQKKSKKPLGVNIHIQKRIPIGAGLGGGSSNGAMALMGLNRLWKTQFSSLQLQRWAAQLGSDLNFFMANTAFALATGRGEKIHPIASQMRLWHILIVPQFPISAHQAYQVFAKKKFLEKATLNKKKKHQSLQKIRGGLEEHHYDHIVHNLMNDLERPILTLAPSLKVLQQTIQTKMQSGFCFSGSGPSIFAITKTKKEAELLMNQFQSTDHQVYVVRTI